jgi:hypothetical protein
VTLDKMAGEAGRQLSVVEVNDFTGLREGKAMFWASFKTLDTDVRGYSFLGPILDQLDSYDTVLSNLVDRTALARYMVWDVTVQGGQERSTSSSRPGAARMFRRPAVSRSTTTR